MALQLPKLNKKHFIIAFAIIAVVIALLFIIKNTQEHMGYHLGTMNQLVAKDIQDSYLI